MLIRGRHHSDDEQWAPVSDLMAVVMLIFMLIAMILFINFDLEKRSNAERCEETRAMLDAEFSADFRKWGAVLEDDLTIRFTNQRVLFAPESADINEKPWFAAAIAEFFPRYMGVIAQIQERAKSGEREVLAIRIEGHTSSEYPGKPDPYIANLELSQDRARNIVEYVLDEKNVPEAAQYQNIVHELVTANGLSSSKLVCAADGKEDKNASRRVEFKLLTDSCQKAGDKIRESVRRCSLENAAAQS